MAAQNEQQHATPTPEAKPTAERGARRRGAEEDAARTSRDDASDEAAAIQRPPSDS